MSCWEWHALARYHFLHEARLTNERCRPGHEIDVCSCEVQLIFDNIILRDGRTFEKVHIALDLLSQETANLNSLASICDVCVDREVNIHQPHPVDEFLFHTVSKF